MNKERIDKLVDIFLNDLESLRHDAGWHSCGLLEKLKMPHVPLRPDLTDAKMIMEITFLTNTHAELGLISAALDRLHQKDHRAWLAILSKRYYQHNYLDHNTHTVKVYKDTNRAQEIGQTPKQFKKNVEFAYNYLAEVLDILELGMLLKKSA